jgi:plasmid stability protein
MANVTIAVPDDVLYRARVRAARDGTSVNSVLRSGLAQYVDDNAELGDAWDHFLDVARQSAGRSADGKRRWHRADLQRDPAADT